MNLNKNNDNPIISHFTLRILIGVLGIALPILLIIDSIIIEQFKIRESISIYYYSNMRDYFIGLLCALGLFLVTYKGKKVIDNIITTFCGVFALGVALFPTTPHENLEKVGIFQFAPDLSAVIHFTSATLFFLLLSINCICFFTRNDSEEYKNNKKKRNKIYFSCGVIIAICIICIGIYIKILERPDFGCIKPVFIFEAIALFAFGVAWLVKGGVMYRDALNNIPNK